MQTLITPNANSAGPRALLTFPVPNNHQPPALAPKAPLPAKLAICSIDLRTPAEDIEFQEAEAIVRTGWRHFGMAGEALIRIRDKQLYKNEYRSFEVYCRERWGFGHTKVWGYISAAEVHKILATLPEVPMPECEAQVRPLIGLPANLAQQAWMDALAWSGGGPLPARLVKRAVRKMLKTEQPAAVPQSSANRQQRHRLRQSVRAGFQELLTLLLGNAERDVLITKVQEIQRLLDPLLTVKKKTKA